MSLGVVALMSVEELKKTIAPADYYEWVGTVLTSETGTNTGAAIVHERRNTFPQGVSSPGSGTFPPSVVLAIPDIVDPANVFCMLTMRDYNPDTQQIYGGAVYGVLPGSVVIRSTTGGSSTFSRSARLVDCVIRYYHGGQ